MDLIIISILLFAFYLYLQSRSGEDRNNNVENFLLTAYPRRFVCSAEQDKRTKHIKLNHTGGVMYVSYSPPFDGKRVECPPLMINEYEKNTMCWVGGKDYNVI